MHLIEDLGWLGSQGLPHESAQPHGQYSSILRIGAGKHGTPFAGGVSGISEHAGSMGQARADALNGFQEANFC